MLICRTILALLLATHLIQPSLGTEISVHYHRPDGDYEDWTLWTWNPDSGKSLDIPGRARDDFGMVFRFETNDYGASGSRIGVLPKYKNWESKDDPDRFWTAGLGEHVYLVSADKTLHAGRPDVSPTVLKAVIEDTDRIRIVLSKGCPDGDLSKHKVVVRDGDGREYPARSVKAGARIKDRVKIVEAELESSLPLDRISGITASFGPYKPGPLVPGKILDQPAFFTDLPLGAIYSKTKTVFRVFAPTAAAVTLRLYDSPQGGVPAGKDMQRIGHGVWETTVKENLLNRYYTYRAKFVEGEYEVIDPYSRCNTAHNGRGLIVDDRTPVAKPPVFRPNDAILYELHIRDFTIDPAAGISALARGKYLGLAEKGSRLDKDKAIQTGIDHLVELGVNVVQIMPFHDFDNNESAEDYNWGYMPFHFFAADGWFASRRDDASRVREVKQMIDAFHRRGIKVVMDVVYNHTAEGNPNIRMSFNGLAPDYYYRLRDDGTYWNGSGCGNEFRSESPMGRKYILDSVKFWVAEYGIDGFRFDLMGLVDLETVKQIVSEVRKIKPDALIYGEPWAGGNTPIDKTEKGDQRGLGFSVFNDHFRDAIKGSTFSNDPGFVQAGRDIDKIKRGIRGSIDDFAKDPVESINYVEAHDNHTLWDRLARTTASRDGVGRDDLIDMDKLAAALVLTSQGIPFLHAGQEMLRTKEGEDNTYNKPDKINMVHWRWKKENREVYDYYRNLVHLRRRHPMFRMATADDVKKNLFFLDDDLKLPVPAKTVGYVLHRGNTGDAWMNALLLFNANNHPVEMTVPAGLWTPADFSSDAAGGSQGRTTASGKIRVPATGAAIFYNTDAKFYAVHLKPTLDARKSRRQKFSVLAPGAKKVSVAGSFNGWNTDQHLLQKQADGSWSIELELAPGAYEYKFLADGEWDALNTDNRKLTVR